MTLEDISRLFVVRVAQTKYDECIDISGQGRSPVWNERFSFKVEYPGGDGQYKLILKIMDKDTFSADDFLGEATYVHADSLMLYI